jgi:ornithine cyclodeaminase
MQMKIRVLSAVDVRAALPPAAAREAAREAFACLARGEADLPLRAQLTTPDGVMLFMPGGAAGALAQKIVGVFPRNSARGLPTINGLVLVFDPATGAPRALLEGGALTAIRTGAASGLATDLLARPDCHTLALFGAGGQAYDQARAVCAVRDIREIRIVSARGQRCRELAKRLRAEGLRARAVASAAEALDGADVVCCATTSRAPLFDDSQLAAGAHLNAAGAYTPDMQEVPPATVRRARIVIDDPDAARAEAGDLLKPLADGLIDESCFAVTLGDVVANRAPGRQTPDEITLFKSVGLAVQDVVAAAAAVARAEADGLGKLVEL